MSNETLRYIYALVFSAGISLLFLCLVFRPLELAFPAKKQRFFRPAWLTDLINGDRSSGSCTTLPAVAGYPHITVPVGYVHGLPVGISFFGAAWSEPKLISLAYAFEQMTKFRRPPKFLPTADLRS